MRHLPNMVSSAKSSETNTVTGSIYDKIGKAVDNKLSSIEGYGVTAKQSPFLHHLLLEKLIILQDQMYKIILYKEVLKKSKKMVDMTGNNEIKRTRTNYKLIDSFNRNKNDNDEEFEAEYDNLSRATPEQDEKYKNLVKLIMDAFGVDESTAKAYRYAFKIT